MSWRKSIRPFLAGSLLVVTPLNADVMVGAFVEGNAWDEQAIVDLNTHLPKSMAFINVFSSFSESWDHLYWQSSKIVNQGMIPMISWMPIDASRYDENILPEIVLGNWDGYIDLWGQKLVDWVYSHPEDNRPSIMLRFGHEFNGNWYSYADSPTWYKAAWQYIYDRFQTDGVNDHIQWVWNANNVNVDSYNDITQYYPGDSYVDWTSIDGYNWGSNYTWTTWDSFTDVFSPVYATLVTHYPDKPILIAEVGSAEPSEVPNPAWGQNGNDNDYAENKDVWASEMLLAIENQFPAIRAVALFNIDKELHWSLTEPTSTGLQGYTSALQSPHFVSDFLSSTTDTSAPTATIIWPANTIVPTSNSDIHGTADDNLSGVERVKIRIDRIDGNSIVYWNSNTSSWTSTKVWNLASFSESSGIWNIGDVDLSTLGNYQINLYLKDQSGNSDLITAKYFAVAAEEIPDRIVDNTPPTALTVFPANSIAPSNHTTIHGTANDDFSDVSKIKVRIDRIDAGETIYWNGSKNRWTNSKYWSLATINTDSGTWTLDGVDLSVPGDYQVRLYVVDSADNGGIIHSNYFTVSHDVSSAEVYIREIHSESSNDLNWLNDLMVQVTISPSSPVTQAAMQTAETLKREVSALVRERQEIVQLEAEVSELELMGSAKDLNKMLEKLAKTRSKFNARKERLLEKKQRQVEKQAQPEKMLKRKTFNKEKQRLRAVSKPLPPMNITKRDRMRNGFKSMSAHQRDQFKAMKRSVLD